MARAFSRRYVMLVAALLALAWGIAVGGTDGNKPPSETSPSENLFPKRLFQGEKADEAWSLLSDYSLVRERRSVFRTTTQVYDYLFARLPLASDMIRALKFGKQKVARLPDGSFSIDTGTRVIGRFWVLHDGERRKVLYGQGEYNGWIIRRIGGRSTVIMTHEPATDEDGVAIKNHMQVFVKIDNVVVEFIVKTVDWLIRLLVRKQLGEASSAARKLTEAIAREPAKVYEELRKSPEIPEPALAEFREMFLSGKSPLGPRLPGSTPQGSKLPGRDALWADDPRFGRRRPNQAAMRGTATTPAIVAGMPSQSAAAPTPTIARLPTP